MLMGEAAPRFDDGAMHDDDYLADARQPKGEPDFCSRTGAHALKEKIEAYWRERGHAVVVALHNVGFHPAIRAARFDVRSDMVNGMPRPAGAAKRGANLGRAQIQDEDFSFE